MRVDTNADPTRITCQKGEKITVTFTPNPLNALSVITYCFNPVCSKDDQRQVIGTRFSFTVTRAFPLQIFFFFIPGEPIGRCGITLTSDNGDTFHIPVPVIEDNTGLVPKNIFIFDIE